MGLVVAGIFAAALSSIDSELNALSTVFIVDWYKRLDPKDRGGKVVSQLLPDGDSWLI